MPEAKEDRNPFKEKPENAGFVRPEGLPLPHIQQLPSRPDKIIRQERFMRVAGKDDMEATIEHYSRHKSLIEHMRNYFGINIPKYELVIGETPEGKEAVYMIADRIEGARLSDVKMDPEINSQLTQFYHRASDYILYCYAHRFPRVTDIGSDQLVYGHPAGDATAPDRLYFIDIEPLTSSPDMGVYKVEDRKLHPVIPKDQTRAGLEELLKSLELDEDKFGSAVDLRESRQYIQDVLNRLEGMPDQPPVDEKNMQSEFFI